MKQKVNTKKKIYNLIFFSSYLFDPRYVSNLNPRKIKGSASFTLQTKPAPIEVQTMIFFSKKSQLANKIPQMQKKYQDCKENVAGQLIKIIDK